MNNRLLSHYGTYSHTEIGGSASKLVDAFEQQVRDFIRLNELNVAELHTLQHIINSSIAAAVAEETLRTGIKVRQEIREASKS